MSIEFPPVGDTEHTNMQSNYWANPRVEAVISSVEAKLPNGSQAAFVVTPPVPASRDTFATYLEDLSSKDDVLSPDFWNGIALLKGPNSAGTISLLQEGFSTWLGLFKPRKVVDVVGDLNDIPDGPYFLLNGSLHQSWKLYPDSLGSFATSIVPSLQQHDAFEALAVASDDSLLHMVAVPSCLYFQITAQKPLAGQRVSVKDNYKVKGIKTTQGNRAFTECYGPESQGADLVARLIDLGAVIVGKTKMCAFASSQEATDQWIDFHAPFNPRADGYQSPSGSTTGGATSLAGYDWLDFSLGTDTTGSIRWPAAWNGLFGLRTTHGAVDLSGIYHSCRKFDALGVLTRDLDQMQAIGSQLLEASPIDPSKFPRRLLYSTDFLSTGNPAQMDLVEGFVQSLEEVLKVQRTTMSIADVWAETLPPEANGLSIADYLSKAAFYPFYWDGYHLSDQFRADYEERFGKPVYVGPYMRWKCDTGANVTEEQVESAEEQLRVFGRWFEENILSPVALTSSNAILVLPLGSNSPKYRDDRNSDPAPVPGFSPNYISAMTGTPQIVAPIGSFPYHSRITAREEQLPVVGSFVGAKGSDMMLINLAKAALEKAGKPTKVLTGRYAIPPSDADSKAPTERL